MAKHLLLLVAVVVILWPAHLWAQQPAHVFAAPIANPFEARIGSMYQADDERLRLDIGASLSFWQDSVSTDLDLEVGADFMTWSRLRVETNFKFPVETIDYWFGVHASVGMRDSPWQARVRLAHISSHLVDGVANDQSVLQPAPFVYSREFAEVLVGHRLRDVPSLRLYAGGTALWATQPDDCNPIIPQFGADFHQPISGAWSIHAGYDARWIGIRDRYRMATAWQAGMHLQNANGTAFLFSFYGYHGRSMHGMFYTGSDDYYALGFQLLL